MALPLPLSSSTSGDGREEVERVARCCFRAPSSFVVVYFCRPKSWARRDARPLLETIGLMRKSVVDTTAPQNRAQFNRAARDARERVGTISARLSRGKWICPRESTATFEMRGRGWVVDDEASTKRHDQSRRSLFFPFFLSFLRKTLRLLGARPFDSTNENLCAHICVCFVLKNTFAEHAR